MWQYAPVSQVRFDTPREAAVGEDDGPIETTTPEGERMLRVYQARWAALQGKTTNRDMAIRLSRILGRTINESRVSEWRRGYHIPSAIILLALAEASDEPVDEVIFGGALGQAMREVKAQLTDRGPTLQAILDRLDRLEQQNRRLLERPDQWGVSVRGRGEVRLGPPGAESEPDPPPAE
jgi:hypothetical protein